MLFVCIDGLSGLAAGIRAIYPQAHVQRCMVHLVRGSLKSIPTKHYKDFCRDAKAIIYGAVSLAAAKEALEDFRRNWADYPAAVRVWVDNFEHVEALFELPGHIRAWCIPPIWSKVFTRHCERSHAARGVPWRSCRFPCALSQGAGYRRQMDDAHSQLVARLGTVGCLVPRLLGVSSAVSLHSRLDTTRALSEAGNGIGNVISRRIPIL